LQKRQATANVVRAAELATEPTTELTTEPTTELTTELASSLTDSHGMA
jgi:hypothetical protein